MESAKKYVSPFACDTESAGFQALELLKSEHPLKEGWELAAAFIERNKNGSWVATLIHEPK